MREAFVSEPCSVLAERRYSLGKRTSQLLGRSVLSEGVSAEEDFLHSITIHGPRHIKLVQQHQSDLGMM